MLGRAARPLGDHVEGSPQVRETRQTCDGPSALNPVATLGTPSKDRQRSLGARLCSMRRQPMTLREIPSPSAARPHCRSAKVSIFSFPIGSAAYIASRVLGCDQRHNPERKRAARKPQCRRSRFCGRERREPLPEDLLLLFVQLPNGNMYTNHCVFVLAIYTLVGCIEPNENTGERRPRRSVRIGLPRRLRMRC
jgi:hypothetical protein